MADRCDCGAVAVWEARSGALGPVWRCDACLHAFLASVARGRLIELRGICA